MTLLAVPTLTGIRYVSDFEPTGYGRAGMGYIEALRTANVPVSWVPMSPGRAWGLWLQPHQGPVTGHPLASLVQRQIRHDMTIVHLLPHYYPRWRATDPAARLVGMAAWETSLMPDCWRDWLAAVDAVMVPTEWNRRSMLEAGMTLPIGVVPHVAACHPDAEPSASPPEALARLCSEDFVFYSIGDWSERKGMHLTLEAYLRAFSRHDPVVLVLKTGVVDERKRREGRWWWHVGRHFSTTREAVRRRLRRHRSPPRVLLLPQPWSHGAIDWLHRRGDCYVSLTRAEGWGLGAFEAAQYAVPVIITGHGGQSAFLPPQLACLVPFGLVPARPMGMVEQKMYSPGDVWAEPELDAAAHFLQEVFANRQDARDRARQLAEHVNREFAPARVASTMLDFLRQL